MRAAVFEAFGRPLVVTDVADPRPDPGELVLRVRAAGVCGTDLHLTAGLPGIPPGSILGHEFAGEVVAVGAGVSGWTVGDRACALPSIGCATCHACATDDPMGCDRLRTLGQGDLPGAFAEFVSVGAGDAFRLPAGVSFDAGGLVEPLAVGLHTVRAARLTAADRVLVLGGGPIGLTAAAWARHAGAATVVVADPQPARRTCALTFGATAAVDPKSASAFADLADACGGQPNVVLECVGRPGFVQESIQTVARHGRIVIAGACMAPDTVMPAMACLKEVSVHFVVAYQRRDFAEALALLAEGTIPGPHMITDRVGFEGFPAAFEALRKPSGEVKVLLQP